MPIRNIGQTYALMPEASTADQSSEFRDGQSGDTNFPYAKFKVLATIGEIDPVTKVALTGYPDGIAAWLKDNSTIRVAYQSESYGTMSNETYPWQMNSGVKFTGSHIHTIDYDRSQFATFLNGNSGPASDMFKSSGFLFNRVFNVFGQEVTPKTTLKTDLAGKWGNQTNPDGTLVEFISGSAATSTTPAVKDMRLTKGDFFFHSFCGAYYEQANKYGTGIGFTDDIWLTAEEWNIGNSMFSDPDGTGPLRGADDANGTMGLASMVVDINSGIAYTAPALGQSGYEKLMPINTFDKDYVAIVASGYNHDSNPAPLKIFIGRKGYGADGKVLDQSSASERDKFLARNGLLYGQLYGMAADAKTYSDLGVKVVDADTKMLDGYLTNAGAPSAFSARYYPTSYRWDGFNTPEAVKDTEIFRWAQDGDTLSSGSKEANSQPTGYTFFNSDTKVEHPAVDPDITKSRYVQNHTSTGALIGVDFINMKQEIAANDLDKNGLPDYLSANITRILSGADGALTLNTGNKGIGHFDAKLNNNLKDASIHIRDNKKAMVSPDGLLWVGASDANVLIVDEDSGNPFGERKFALRIDPNDLGVLPDATGYFLAQAGGTLNPRALAKVAANPGDFEKASGSEFSGSWDVTAFITRKEDGTFYTLDELKGIKKAAVESGIALADHLFIGSLQHQGESGGAVKANLADYGGQILQFNMAIPTGKPIYRLLDKKDGSHLFTTSSKERDVVTGQDFTYEGVGFNLPYKGTQDLHRFYNRATNDHFYTANEAEKALILSNASLGFAYEGSIGKVWAAGSGIAGSTPVYRLFHSVQGHHYTIDQSERSQLLKNSTGWTDEGIGFNI